MRTGINLASHPHRAADVQPLVRWLPLFLAAALTVVHVYWVVSGERLLDEKRARVSAQEAELKAFVQEEEAARAALQSVSGQKALRELAVFSYTNTSSKIATPALVLAEVASALPPRAHALSFAIRWEGDGAQMSLDVASLDPEAASELAARLERSELFQNPELVDEHAIETGGYRFRVIAGVVPRGGAR